MKGIFDFRFSIFDSADGSPVRRFAGSRRRGSRRGAAFIITIWTMAVLTGLALAIGQVVRVEGTAAADRAGMAEADAAELGAEQFVLSAVDLEVATPGATTENDDVLNMMSGGLQMGDVTIWIIKPDPDDETALDYGLTDEAGKADINYLCSTGNETAMMNLPNMTEDVADSIMDWYGPATTPRPEGAEDTYYAGLPTPYLCKNAPFETVEELMLVKGIDADFMFGLDKTRSGRWDQQAGPATQSANNLLATPTLTSSTTTSDRGLFPYVTVYGVKAGTTPPAPTNTSLTGATASVVADVNSTNQNTLRQVLAQYLGGNANAILQQTAARVSPAVGLGAGGRPGAASPGRPFANIWDWAVTVNLTSQQFSTIIHHVKATVPSATGTTPAAVAKINVNTAPEAVLMCLPTLVQSDADAIIAYRQSNPEPEDPSDISWLLDVVPRTKLGAIGSVITGQSACFSADIVAATNDGRVFKRCRIVVDASSGTSKIIYRRDLTAYGWPLTADIREALRQGQFSNSQPMGVKPF